MQNIKWGDWEVYRFILAVFFCCAVCLLLVSKNRMRVGFFLITNKLNLHQCQQVSTPNLNSRICPLYQIHNRLKVFFSGPFPYLLLSRCFCGILLKILKQWTKMLILFLSLWLDNVLLCFTISGLHTTKCVCLTIFQYYVMFLHILNVLFCCVRALYQCNKEVIFACRFPEMCWTRSPTLP